MKRGKGLTRKTRLPAGASQLSRTPLSRSKGLDSGGGAKPFVRKAAAKKRQRDTGPSAKVREQVRIRDLDSCVCCGLVVTGRPSNVHHRRNRGLGGSKNPRINAIENLVTLCGSPLDGCHGLATNKPWEIDAEKHGWVVSTNGQQNPASVPVLVAWLGWCYPTASGEWQVIEDIDEVTS